jgi:hypothetical protein
VSATPHIFPAGPKRSVQIAELYRMAAGGVADHMRSGLVEGNETMLDVDTRRLAPTGEDYSFENCTMATADGQIAGVIHAYTLRECVEIDPDFGLVTWPYAELEQVPSPYIAVIAFYPNRRGRTIGEAFLKAFAERHADSALNQHSLLQYAADVLLTARTL